MSGPTGRCSRISDNSVRAHKAGKWVETQGQTVNVLLALTGKSSRCLRSSRMGGGKQEGVCQIRSRVCGVGGLLTGSSEDDASGMAAATEVAT